MAKGTRITRHQRLRRRLRSPLRHGKLWDNRAGRQYQQAAETLVICATYPSIPWLVRHQAEQEAMEVIQDIEPVLARRGMLHC